MYGTVQAFFVIFFALRIWHRNRRPDGTLLWMQRPRVDRAYDRPIVRWTICKTWFRT